MAQVLQTVAQKVLCSKRVHDDMTCFAPLIGLRNDGSLRANMCGGCDGEGASEDLEWRLAFAAKAATRQRRQSWFTGTHRVVAELYQADAFE